MSDSNSTVIVAILLGGILFLVGLGAVGFLFFRASAATISSASSMPPYAVSTPTVITGELVEATTVVHEAAPGSATEPTDEPTDEPTSESTGATTTEGVPGTKEVVRTDAEVGVKPGVLVPRGEDR